MDSASTDTIAITFHDHKHVIYVPFEQALLPQWLYPAPQRHTKIETHTNKKEKERARMMIET
jgi:hypothetical protein